MPEAPTKSETTVLVCSCEGTMPLDVAAIARACPGMAVTGATNLCGKERDLFRAKAAKPGDLLVACTQEAALFAELADDGQLPATLQFTNIRERAGWSAEAAKAGPKTAALLAAAAARPSQPAHYVKLESAGVTLILGRDETALGVADALAGTLDLTVVLTGETDIVPPRARTYPIRRGIARSAKGHLGQLEVTLDNFAAPAASSRALLEFGPSRNGLVSRADIVIDLTGRPALFTAPDLRDGYLRADPDNAIEVERLIRKAADLVGTFDKPRYIAFKDDLCAHSRSRKTGCTRCLDLCPTGAITPAGDHVAIDPYVCGGCGACNAVCPTGAAAYAYPPTTSRLAELRALLATYHAAGGRDAVVLVHDAGDGAALIDAAARFSRGLPARVLPIEIDEPGQLGLEGIASAFAYGAAQVRVLLKAKPRHEPGGLRKTLELSEALLAPLGFGAGAAATIETDDPDAMLAALDALPAPRAAANPAKFAALGGKRDMLRLALTELGRVAPTPVETIVLPAGAPLGRVAVDTQGCTLCLSCVSACPTSALTAGDDRPLLRFDESLCVQCGLCKSTCPEKVISLEPRLSFKAFEEGPVVVKEEEPFCCISCGKPFGVKSTIERIVAKLDGKHWMFKGEGAARLDLIRMCEDCRVTSVTNTGLDPYAANERPRPRTSDDYFAEREKERAKKDKKD